MEKLKIPIAGVGVEKAKTPPSKTPADLLNEASSTGKSWLQLYQENMPKPEYEQERANRIQTNSKASVIADILKLAGEGVTTSFKGTPISRQSAVPMLNAELQKLNDTYKAESRAYKQGGFNALLMDEQEKRRALIERARLAAKLANDLEREKAKETQGKFVAEEGEKKRKHDAEQKELSRKNALKVSNNRRSSSGGDRGNGDVVPFVDTDYELKQIPKNEKVAWSDKLAKMILEDPNFPEINKKALKAYPQNAWTYWDRYLEFDGRKLRKKGGKKKSIQGFGNASTTNNKNNTTTKKIVGF